MTDRTLTEPDGPTRETRTRTEPSEDRPGRPLVLPVLLIGLGVIFLLQNLGVVDADIWGALARLWPVALIGIGLDLVVGRRSRSARVAVAAGVLALVAALVAWMLASGTGEATIASISQTRDGADRAEIRLSSGVGGLELEAVDGAALLEGSVAVPAGHELIDERTDDGGTAEIELRTEGGLSFGFFRRDDVPAWDLQLAGHVPTVLDLDTGVGESVLDLRAADLRSLSVDAGVGSTTITLPESGDATADLNGGVGEIVVRVPADVAVRIQADTGIGDVDVDGPWTRDDERWVSDGFDGASDRVDLTVETGVGEVRVEQIP